MQNKNAKKLESLEAVHTHTHTHTQYDLEVKFANIGRLALIYENIIYKLE